ncbi:MAG: InlB B-repeat-containing protein, partial [Anaerolineales bacterium]
YVSGEKITFTAKPNSGYTVDKWTGTDDDSLTSLTNTLKMPAAASAVSVTYKLLPPPCFALTLGVTAGSGSVPTASASTMGCAAGKYAAGEVITVTAAPTGGGAVDSWQITPVQSPTTTGDPNVIEVTMPASALTVKVTYNP